PLDTIAVATGGPKGAPDGGTQAQIRRECGGRGWGAPRSGGRDRPRSLHQTKDGGRTLPGPPSVRAGHSNRPTDRWRLGRVAPIGAWRELLNPVARVTHWPKRVGLRPQWLFAHPAC